MILSDYIQSLENKFAQADIPKEEAGRLVRGVLGLTATGLILKENENITQSAEKNLDSKVERRLNGEPLQYLLGEWGFWNSDFKVGPGVLIPRPETEHVVELLLQIKQDDLKIAELWAGSGNIGISVLQERNWEWHAFEANPNSLPYLEENIQRLLPLKNRYSLHAGDFFEGAKTWGPFDGIVSNPPYIETAEIATLSREVQREPLLALDGGATGLEVIEKLSREAFTLLKPGGFILMEIGFGQEVPVIELLQKIGFNQFKTTLDLALIPRVIEGKKPWIH